MAFFDKFILVILTIGTIFLLYQLIRYKPGLFSKQALSKSFSSMGILGLILIAVIGVVVKLLRG